MRSAHARNSSRPRPGSWPARPHDAGLLFGLLLLVAGCSSREVARTPAADSTASLAAIDQPARLTRAMEISPRTGWIGTEFQLAVGDPVQLHATGRVRAEAAHEGWVSEPTGPEGWTASRMEWFDESEDHVRVASAPRMALLARIGAGEPVSVIASPVLVANAPGELMLCVNDVPAKAPQASGSFHVEIEGPRRALPDSLATVNP